MHVLRVFLNKVSATKKTDTKTVTSMHAKTVKNTENTDGQKNEIQRKNKENTHRTKPSFLGGRFAVWCFFNPHPPE